MTNGPGMSDAPPSSRGALIGIALTLVGMLMFAANDALGKWLVETYSAGQVLLIRSLAALVIFMPFLWRIGFRELFRPQRPGLQVARAVFATSDAFFFYWAVAYLPLADAMTYWMAAPIYVAALSSVLLGEKVGWRRWTAICVGFLGVVIALRPSAATLTLPAFLCIAGSLAFALGIMLSRTLRGTPDVALVFYQMLGAIVLGLFMAPFQWNETPTLIDFSLLSLLGIVAMIAHVCVARSLKFAEASTVMPFHYSLLIWAVVFGYVFFGDIPHPAVIVGGLLIVAAGLFIFFREQRLGKKAPEESLAPTGPTT
ncbi:permease [Agaricicola taiwanensis]|uniref:Permease n=1 Tax=Agaricicola taiwanensis TaxID=591372 RepID=A0A8J2VXV4_9RHOB|nr:DMT family transporter [Agaricicola taiwanensis]GGE40472.1 permease [Agaricicola taiwanensis]